LNQLGRSRQLVTVITVLPGIRINLLTGQFATFIFTPLHFSGMNSATPTTRPDSDEELDDPYIHIVSTEEFVESVEHDGQHENNEELDSNED